MHNSASVQSCLFCSSPSISFWHTHAGADGVPYKVVRCSGCGGAFVSPPPSSECLDAFYRGASNSHGGSFDPGRIDSHYEQILERERAYPNSTLDAKRLAAGARQLTAGRKLLDVGAGYGFFSNAASKEGFECTAIEPGENNGAVFERMNGFRPLEGTFDAQFAKSHERAFDVVLLSQVLEHIPYPKQAAQNIGRVLKDGGVCVIAVPHFGSYLSRLQGKRDMFIVPPEHVNFFSMPGLKTLFKDAGFRCADAYTVSRYDRSRLRGKLKAKPVADIGWALLSRFMAFSDARDRGMFINAFFVKQR